MLEPAHKFESTIVSGKFLPGLHGLRGMAALAVVLYHLVHIGKISPPNAFDFVGRDFGYSVHLFFILSAFSLCCSINLSKNNNWIQSYLIRRYFRIAPLFYFMIIHEVLRQYISGGKVFTDFGILVLNATLAFGVVPFQGIVWGGWSVGVEVIFYVFFPILILTIRSTRSALIFMCLSLLIGYLIRSSLHNQYVTSIPLPRWDWSYFSFSSNIGFFSIGIFAFYFAKKFGNRRCLSALLPVGSIVLIYMLLILNVGQYIKGPGRWDIFLWGVAFAALSVWQSGWPNKFFANKIMIWSGERSFSIYLLHPVIIYYGEDFFKNLYNLGEVYIGASAFFLCAFVLFGIIAIIAEITYKLIEVPGISFGRRLVYRMATINHGGCFGEQKTQL